MMLYQGLLDNTGLDVLAIAWSQPTVTPVQKSLSLLHVSHSQGLFMISWPWPPV